MSNECYCPDCGTLHTIEASRTPIPTPHKSSAWDIIDRESRDRAGMSLPPAKDSVVTWPTIAMWDAWYSSIPTDIKQKLSPHDLKRISDCFKASFGIPDVLKPPYPFCLTPDKCAGKGYCPRDIACND